MRLGNKRCGTFCLAWSLWNRSIWRRKPVCVLRESSSRTWKGPHGRRLGPLPNSLTNKSCWKKMLCLHLSSCHPRWLSEKPQVRPLLAELFLNPWSQAERGMFRINSHYLHFCPCFSKAPNVLFFQNSLSSHGPE